MTDRRYGGFWRRFWAFLIDKAVVCAVTLLFYQAGRAGMEAAGMPLGIAAPDGDLPRTLGRLTSLYLAASFVAGMAYFTWFHGTLGRTPGKTALGLKVVQVSGEPMTLGVAFLRWSGTLVSCAIGCLGYLWIAFDPRKQGWHDKIAATLVVRSAGKTEPAAGNDGPGGSLAATAAEAIADPESVHAEVKMAVARGIAAPSPAVAAAVASASVEAAADAAALQVESPSVPPAGLPPDSAETMVDAAAAPDEAAPLAPPAMATSTLAVPEADVPDSDSEKPRA